MSAYTEQNLIDVQQAIIDLAAGKRRVSVTINGRTMQYGQASLGELRRLRVEIQSERNAAAGEPAFVLTTTGKGL